LLKVASRHSIEILIKSMLLSLIACEIHSHTQC